MSNQTVINLLLLLRGLMVMSVIVGKGCDGWVFELPRKLMTRESPEVSSPIPAPSQYYIETKERCSDPIGKRGCRDLTDNITACLLSSNTSSRELFLLVQNDGEGILKVNFTMTDIKVTFPEIQLSKHDAKKIDISENVEGSPSIIVKTGNGSCMIQTGSSQEPKVKYEPFFGHGTYLSPKYGAYLFFIAMIVGGAWACCWFLKSEQHVDGVPYQELEMERPDSHSANNVETTEGWDEGWDDDWDEIKEVRQPNGHKTANVSSNVVIASRNADTEEGGKDWDD
ncbi:hypothetical protein SADUNF_Sadunf19G0067500 [Salix dunnii]|uniref:DUF7356 domain-containing protein n=1 Tax=Salix dunnii TaxID=1413687 RepID=A0A835J1L0_9ROSI|nr:hypothetical protein SADUNF_Sadunf19G0067500 [Salix dunnii]